MPFLESGIDPHINEVELNSTYLRSNRIVSHMVADPLARPFDILRTQILQSMDAKGTKVLAVTSPTPGCGKTVTALNLALSIERLPERSVLMVDLDFVKPNVAPCLGIKFDQGVLDVLAGRTGLRDAIIHARIGSQQLMVLPTTATTGSSELMSSREMSIMLQELRRSLLRKSLLLICRQS